MVLELWVLERCIDRTDLVVLYFFNREWRCDTARVCHALWSSGTTVTMWSTVVKVTQVTSNLASQAYVVGNLGRDIDLTL